MYVAWIVVSLLLSLACLISAAGKLRRIPQVVESLHSVGVRDSQFPILAGLQIAAAAGLVLGTVAVPYLAAVTAGALTLYFAFATAMHVRSGDRFPVPTIVLMLLSAASLWLGVMPR